MKNRGTFWRLVIVQNFIISLVLFHSIVYWFFFQENYGVNDPVAVAKVKEVYSKLDMKSIYHEHEKKSYEKLMKLIDKAPIGLPKEIFTELAAKIYKREK